MSIYLDMQEIYQSSCHLFHITSIDILTINLWKIKQRSSSTKGFTLSFVVIKDNQTMIRGQ